MFCVGAPRLLCLRCTRNSGYWFMLVLLPTKAKLDAMPIGKCSLQDHLSKDTQKYCWLNGFSQITKNNSSQNQLQKLGP